MTRLPDSRSWSHHSPREEEGPLWLRGGGIIANEIAHRDWDASPLGPLNSWPHTLQSALNVVLNSGLSMLVLWGDSLLTFYNDAYAPILLGKQNTLGRPFAEIFPEAWDQVGPLLRKALSGEATFFESFPVTIERGGELQDSWWTFSYSPIFDEAGQIAGVFAPVHEITARVTAEAQLRESETNFKIVSDIMPSMLWRIHADTKILWMNRRMRDYLGPVDRAEWFHPDDWASILAEWGRAKREGNSFHHSHRLKGADGTYRWHVATSEPRRGPSGDIEEWVGITTDIHDMHVAADALAENEARFRSFANNSTDMLWIADAESGEVDYVSPAFESIWGPLPASTRITWAYWLSTIHPDDRGQPEEALERLQGGEVLHQEYRIIRCDGTVRWVRNTMFPIVSPDGLIRKIGAIAQDITRENRMVVHLIDPQPESRNSLSRRLQAVGYQVRSFADVDSFLRVVRALVAGCVILHDHDDAVEARRLARTLKDQVQRLPLVLVHDLKDAAEAVHLMKLGVNDILFPSELDERLEQVVATALATMQSYAREEVAGESAREKLQTLTERERQILNRLGDGATNKMIGRDLGLSPRTVETYRLRILERLGVATLPEAIKLAAIGSI